MKYLEILKERAAELAEQRATAFAAMEAITEVAAAEERSALTDVEEAEFTAARGKVADLDVEIEKVNARIGELNVTAERATAAAKAPQIIRKSNPIDVIEDRSATPIQLADALTRSVETKVEDANNMDHARQLFKRHANDRDWARNLVVRSTPDYTSAFFKMVTGREAMLTTEERAAMSITTNANGNFLVPTHLDPTVILSNDGSSNAIRRMSRVVTLTRPGDSSWQGITSSGVTASFDAELAEVSDDSPTFSQPSVSVHKAQAFVQGSVELLEDAAGLESDILMMFADARDRLEGTAHATGSGSGQPYGIFTALDANTNVEITTTTAATVGVVDLHSVYRQVPVRFRSKATWLSHPIWSLEIKRLGTAVAHTYSGDLREAPAERLLGRPFIESDDAPSTQTTTALDNVLILGDFSNYVIVDKPGSMTVQFVPVMFNTSNNLPDGRVGWYARWRTGADSVLDTAFRLLQDKTSA